MLACFADACNYTHPALSYTKISSLPLGSSNVPFVRIPMEKDLRISLATSVVLSGPLSYLNSVAGSAGLLAYQVTIASSLEALSDWYIDFEQ